MAFSAVFFSGGVVSSCLRRSSSLRSRISSTHLGSPIDRNHWIGFVGKILTGNHGFYMFLPWRSWGFPVPIFPLIQPSEWSEPCVRKYFGIWNWDVIIVLVYRALYFTSHPNSWARKFWRHLQWFLLGFGFLSPLLIFLFLRWMSTPRREDSETFGVSKASLKCH